MEFIGVVFIGLFIYAIIVLIQQSRKDREEAERIEKMSKDEAAAYHRKQQEHENLRNQIKYNNYIWTCPMCGSHKVLRISKGERITSVAVMGLASEKIGKQYVCDNCKHKW